MLLVRLSRQIRSESDNEALIQSQNRLKVALSISLGRFNLIITFLIAQYVNITSMPFIFCKFSLCLPLVFISIIM